MPPLDLGDLDLHAYLWPDLDPARLEERVTAPAMTPRHFERMIAGIDIDRGSASARARYDSAVLSVGQRARDLLTGKPSAWWNLTQRRIEQLEPQHEGAERYAVETERAAAAARQRADRLRGELEAARARLAELDAAGARAT